MKRIYGRVLIAIVILSSCLGVYAAVTPSNLPGTTATIGAYTSGGSLTHNDFNAITGEITKTQSHFARNMNLLGVVNVLDYATSPTVNADGSYTITSNDVNNAISNSGNRQLIYIPNHVKVRCISTIHVPVRKILYGGTGTRVSIGTPFEPTLDMATLYLDNSSGFTGPMIRTYRAGGLKGLFISAPDTNQDYVGVLMDATGQWPSAQNDDGIVDNCWFIRTKLVCRMVQGFEFHNLAFDGSYGWQTELYGCMNNKWSHCVWYSGGNGVAGKGEIYIDQYNNNGTMVPTKGQKFSLCCIDCSGRDFYTGGNSAAAQSVAVSMQNCQGIEFTATDIFAHYRGIVINGGCKNISISAQFATIIKEAIYITGTGNSMIRISSTFADKTGLSMDSEISQDTSCPVVRTVGAISRVVIYGSSFETGSTHRTTAIELSSGTTKCRISDILLDGVFTTAVSDLNGTNSVGTVVN